MASLFRTLGTAALAMTALLSAHGLAAAQDLTVVADQSQIINLDRPPATVVVGNPTIADVTMQGRMMFVHGRVFGSTNIIALDEAGQQLAEYQVNVVVRDDYNVVVYKAGVGASIQKESYSCKEDCESVFHIGDSLDYYKLINEQQKNKLGLAQGQKAGDDASNNGAPPPSE